MRLYTIGFTQKTAQRFFTLLRSAGVRRVIDTRLNNRSQLAGFSKAEDLPFFLHALDGIEYRHSLEMAPTQEMLDGYKKHRGSWTLYQQQYLQLLKDRALAERITPGELDGACLLCSEHRPDHCHRRLAAEYLKQHHPELEIVHLL
jgi:uncharacterized protein (DUF488 family)